MPHMFFIMFSVIDESEQFFHSIKILFFCLLKKLPKTSESISDAMLGNLLILSQSIDFTVIGQEQEKCCKLILEFLAGKKTFLYPNLISYVVDADILEELAFLAVNKKADLKIAEISE